MTNIESGLGGNEEENNGKPMYDWWESLTDDQRQQIEDGGGVMEQAFELASENIARAEENIALIESDPFFQRGFPSDESWSEQSRWMGKEKDLKFFKKLLENKGLEKKRKPRVQTETDTETEA